MVFIDKLNVFELVGMLSVNLDKIRSSTVTRYSNLEAAMIPTF